MDISSATYCRLSKETPKKSNITIEALEKLLGYNYTAAHWLRKDFSHWGKGGSLPRPSDWSKLKGF
jgi:hypothetical protein